jgi:hypothetical protein
MVVSKGKKGRDGVYRMTLELEVRDEKEIYNDSGHVVLSATSNIAHLGGYSSSSLNRN